MPEYTSISRISWFPLLLLAASAHAESAPASKGRTEIPEEEDFSKSPFTEYAEFNEESDEAADTRFFQYGRFFGVSLGAGLEGVSGNRGLLWQGGFPAIDLKVHYWFDFNFALTLGMYTANHAYDYSGGHVNVNMFRLGVDLKYYFETRNLSAAISFANPHVIGGFGNFSKTETNTTAETSAADSSTGVSVGAGLEFALKPRKVYFTLESKLHFVNFKDTFSTQFADQPGIPNLEGFFYTIMGNFLFTW